MRHLLIAAAAVCALGGTVAGCAGGGGGGGPARHAQPPASYYLALGDSLSLGVQPDSAGTSVPTPDGYADQLYTVLRRSRPGLRLVKLGCSGETTATMIHGGICAYRGGSQLAAAVSFLRAHRGRVALITLDIGANDPDSCITRQSVIQLATCAARSIPQAVANLTAIVTRLRRASPGTRIVAMNYYLPALAAWRTGLVGQILARTSEVVTSGYNTLLDNVYRAHGVRVANVFGAFHSSDFGPQVAVPGLGSLPRNVAAVCRWTWECAAGPRGPNEHANQAGYEAIARAFLLAGAGARAGGRR
jgi:lysophospholipase L1-like esterase